jgi:Uma2 family endonuclease
MSQFLPAYDLKTLVANLVTEDNEPVDNVFSAKQQRLLVEPLVSSWRPIDTETGEPRTFFADADVGVFNSVHQPPIVPDMFLSLDVELPENPDFSVFRSYFVWEFGKVPDAAVEIVSNTKGGEISNKKNRYAQLGVQYYVVHDPFGSLSDERLRVFELGFGKRYRQREDFSLPDVGLTLTLWCGEFEGFTEEWLRWCDAEGNLILTGAERAQLEAERADREVIARREAESEIEKLRAEILRLQGK